MVGVGWTSRAPGQVQTVAIERVVVIAHADTALKNRDRGCGVDSGTALIWMNVCTPVGVAAIEVRGRVLVECRVVGVPDQGTVTDAKSWHTDSQHGRRSAFRRTVRKRETPTSRPILVGIRPHNAVGRIDELVRQWSNPSLQQLLAALGPVAAIERHFELAQRRPFRPRSAARQLDELPGCGQRAAVGLVDKYMCLRIGWAEPAAPLLVLTAP